MEQRKPLRGCLSDSLIHRATAPGGMVLKTHYHGLKELFLKIRQGSYFLFAELLSFRNDNELVILIVGPMNNRDAPTLKLCQRQGYTQNISVQFRPIW